MAHTVGEAQANSGGAKRGFAEAGALSVPDWQSLNLCLEPFNEREQQHARELVQFVCKFARNGHEGRCVGTLIVFSPTPEDVLLHMEPMCSKTQSHLRDGGHISLQHDQQAIIDFCRDSEAVLFNGSGELYGCCLRLKPPISNGEQSTCVGISKHISAQSLTEACQLALAICVSASDGTVSVFHQGMRVLRTDPLYMVRAPVRMIITEKLNDEFSKQKKVYRVRIMPCAPKVNRKDDNLIGGHFDVPSEMIPHSRVEDLQGGMSVVMVIPQDTEEWEQNIASKERESQILRELYHKNIVGVVLPFQEIVVKNRVTSTFTQCMIIDAVRPLGFDLVAYLQMFRASKQTPPLEHVRWFVSQMQDGIQYIHEKNIVHRDLKPDNILIDSDFNLKIIDFGYASAPGMQLEEFDSSYLAPEVNDEKQSPSIDFWGIGVVVHSFYHDWDKIRKELEAAQLDQDRFWAPKHFPEWGQTKIPIADGVMDLRRGLLCINHNDRWGSDKLEHWLTSSPLERPHGPVPQIYPWLGDVKSVFLLTLPPHFQTKTLGELRLKAMILMIDGPDGIDLRLGKDTKLKAGFKVYFAFKLNLSDDVVDKEVFQKLQILDMVREAIERVPTDDNISDKLIQLGRMAGKDSRITTLRPIFDTFRFPDHCAGAMLGPDGLDLRGLFQIPVVALVRQDGSVVWWPGPDDVVHRGDQGLLVRDFTEEHRQTPIITMHMEKVSFLHVESRFRQKFALVDGERYHWQIDDVTAEVHKAKVFVEKATNVAKEVVECGVEEQTGGSQKAQEENEIAREESEIAQVAAVHPQEGKEPLAEDADVVVQDAIHSLVSRLVVFITEALACVIGRKPEVDDLQVSFNVCLMFLACCSGDVIPLCVHEVFTRWEGGSLNMLLQMPREDCGSSQFRGLTGKHADGSLSIYKSVIQKATLQIMAPWSECWLSWTRHSTVSDKLLSRTTRDGVMLPQEDGRLDGTFSTARCLTSAFESLAMELYTAEVACASVPGNVWKAEEDVVADVSQLAEPSYEKQKSMKQKSGRKAGRHKGGNFGSLSQSILDRRIDPSDGVEYSWQELSMYYKGKYEKKAIEEYWRECCKPIEEGMETTVCM